jgi:hypothetical protein
MKLSSSLRALLVAAVVAVPAFGAFSASTPSTAIASQAAAEKKEAKPRVAVDATFERFLLDAHGRIHGILLKDGSVVRAHEGAVRDTSLKAGDALKVEAHAKAVSGVNLYGRALVKKNGAVVVDATQKPADKGNKGDKKDKAKGAKLADMTATGTISFFLYDRDGGVHGVVLSDGLVAQVGKKAKLDDYKLKKGDSVTVTGKGGSYALGRALRIESIKLPNGDVKKP